MAGSATITISNIDIPWHKKDVALIKKVLIEWTGDSNNGSVPDTAFSASNTVEIIGRDCSLAVTDPGSTAPTDNYDITIEDEYGVDIMGGSLLNRNTANSEQAIPQVGSGLASRLCAGTWSFKLSGNSVNSATGKCVLYFEI